MRTRAAKAAKLLYRLVKRSVQYLWENENPQFVLWDEILCKQFNHAVAYSLWNLSMFTYELSKSTFRRTKNFRSRHDKPRRKGLQLIRAACTRTARNFLYLSPQVWLCFRHKLCPDLPTALVQATAQQALA
ncbi:hypothetical protein PilKf_00991 [Pillotina sp. SPG140]